MTTLSDEQQSQLESMSLAEKIAIFLLQLGEDMTARVFTSMNVESITAVSKYLADETKEVFKLDRDIRVIHNFFDASAFTPLVANVTKVNSPSQVNS